MAIGMTEILIVAVLILILFGPSRLPKLARSVGSAVREYRTGMNETKRKPKG